MILPTGCGLSRLGRNVLTPKTENWQTEARQQISRYHAADCSSRKGEFKGWSKEEQIEFTKGLLSVFKRRFLNVVAYSMPLQEFTSVFPECAANPVVECYRELLKFLMLEIVDQINTAKQKFKGRTKAVKVVLFHDRGNYDADLRRSFNRLLNDPTSSGSEVFSTIEPLSWENSLPLQAADLIAYETFKEAQRQLTGRNRRKTLSLLLDMDYFGCRAKTFQIENMNNCVKLLIIYVTTALKEKDCIERSILPCLTTGQCLKNKGKAIRFVWMRIDFLPFSRLIFLKKLTEQTMAFDKTL